MAVRVYGPYSDDTGRWKVFVVVDGKTRTSKTFAERAAAEQYWSARIAEGAIPARQPAGDYKVCASCGSIDVSIGKCGACGYEAEWRTRWRRRQVTGRRGGPRPIQGEADGEETGT